VIQLQVDGSDRAQANVPVSAVIATGGGTLTGTTTVTTDAAGRATFTDLAVTGDPGTRTLTFTAPDYTSVTSGSIDVQAPPPAPPDGSQSSVAVDPATIAVGQTATITVTVRDAAGTPLADRSVSVSADGNEIPGSPGTTNESGIATFSLSPTTPGSVTITATSGGMTLGDPQTVTVTP
jgi:Bacterial Ig-like domain (group 1)